LPLRRAGKVNSSGRKGESLPEGWYTDTGTNQIWTPPSYISNYVSGETSPVLINDELYLLFYADGTLTVREFDGEKYEDFASYSVGERRALDKEGWWYTSGERLNFVTGARESIATSPVTFSGEQGTRVGDVVYFETRFAPPSANSQNYRYNESTNTWTTMNSRTGASYSSFHYNGFLYNVGVTTVSPRYANIYRYDPATNLWSFVSDSPVPPTTNPLVMRDKMKLIGDEIYMVLEGYKYNIPGNEWIPITSVEGMREVASGVVSFRHRNIIYHYFRHGTWSRVPYNTAAYALPGAVVPH
jgi:hypothetical protein